MIVDVDTGIDDSLALLYLLAHPRAEILSIASTAGNVPVDQVAANNLAWLDLCKAGDIEVTLGAQTPLLAPLMTTEDTHGPQGIGYAELPVSQRKLSNRNATNAWVELVRERPGQITGLVTGPLTNLAMAIRIEPALPRLLQRLVVMGGAFHHPGNTTPTSEWNIAVDPEAAAEVFAAFAGLPADRLPIICPLDITETMEMRPAHIARLAERAGSSPAEVIADHHAPTTRSAASNPVIRHFSDAVRFYMEFHRDHDQGFLAHMHDPFAAAVALDPSIVTCRVATVDVELAGTLTRGTTVADWRGMWGREPNAAIATTTDPVRFFDDLIDRVGGMAERLY
ncbi:nucleoside hydrolase [Rhodococcoides yunnanense]|jgi:purine nucleosidase|uniref:nucleoside hydrolase n=1 Tax=Rhodococcoides yunnanense TaxID=278209 RepID=UPI0022B1BA30|nr:nucleoside hydrolase [Rhodococcus yunnanensis]MCZ4275195.1 nucleoside hydrolase [Rhodococcus yunnanensis]